MYLSIITLPLLGSIVSGFFGRKIGVDGARILGCLCIFVTTIFAIVAFFEVGFNNNPVSLYLFKWLNSETFNMIWHFQFDNLTISMLIPVLIISSLVHFYSIGYMSADPHNQRFFSYLSLFTFMMIILVTGNNYLLMFVGWEGVGVCSYLLVSFWFTRIAANQSSMSAFLTNRVGDCLLTIGMFSMLWSLGNLDYSTAFSLSPYVNENTITIIGICFLIGAMAKSSQVGLHIWLPMAMEGPTPVSALIHAATMVTAGVYLLIRSSPLIEYSSTVLLICLWLGAITTVFSSLVGLFQQDIKKIIAYSTMSQLGMMVISIGLSSYNIALFHLVNHAFYKGLLFLGAGAVIHAVSDNQDLRKYGGLRTFLPLTYTVILIASLSLVAIPFMTGFYSKDFILESAYGQFYFSSITVYFIAVIGAIFTTLYSAKVLYLTFIANPNGPKVSYVNAHEGDIFLSLPLVVLAIFSVYFGFITKDIFIGLGSGFFMDNSIFIHPVHEILINTEFGVATIFKLLPFIFTIAFSALAIILSEFTPNLVYNFKLSKLGYYIYGFFNQRFLVELLYNKYIVNLVLNLGGQTTKVLDKGSIELLGPFGIEKVLIKLSKGISNLNTSVVTNYALYILIGMVVYMIISFVFFYLFDSIYMILTFSIIIFSFVFLALKTSESSAPIQKNIGLESNFFSIVIFNNRNMILIMIKIFLLVSFLISNLYLGINDVTIFCDSDSEDNPDIPRSPKGKGIARNLSSEDLPITENAYQSDEDMPNFPKKERNLDNGEGSSKDFQAKDQDTEMKDCTSLDKKNSACDSDDSGIEGEKWSQHGEGRRSARERKSKLESLMKQFSVFGFHEEDFESTAEPKNTKNATISDEKSSDSTEGNNSNVVEKKSVLNTIFEESNDSSSYSNEDIKEKDPYLSEPEEPTPKVGKRKNMDDSDSEDFEDSFWKKRRNN